MKNNVKKLIGVAVALCVITVLCVCSFTAGIKSAQSENANSDSTAAVIVSSRIPVDEADTSEFVTSYEIEAFPYILQTPELPTGCEITALTMAINYYGYDVDKVTMAESYLPTMPYFTYYDEDGILHGNDLNDYFLGDPTSAYGYVCGTNAIVTAANDYFSDVQSPIKAKDITGYSFDEMYNLVANDTPVVIWITINMAERTPVEGWYTDNGSYVDWSHIDHAGVLVGYTDDTVIIADPLVGRTEYNRETFESVYKSRNCQGVILE